jgi:hypothetical protein
MRRRRLLALTPALALVALAGCSTGPVRTAADAPSRPYAGLGSGDALGRAVFAPRDARTASTLAFLSHARGLTPGALPGPNETRTATAPADTR